MGLWRMMKSRLYMTTGNDQLTVDWEEAPKHFPKPNLYQKMVMVTVWWSAAGLIYYSFLNIGKIITSEKYIQQQINEMYQKLQWLQLALVNRKQGPIILHNNARPHVVQPMLQKLNKLGYEALPNSPYSSDLLPTDYHFFKHLDNFFCRKMLPQPAGGWKCFPRVHWILKHRFLHYKYKKLISHWQKYVDWLTKMCLSLATII